MDAVTGGVTNIVVTGSVEEHAASSAANPVANPVANNVANSVVSNAVSNAMAAATMAVVAVQIATSRASRVVTDSATANRASNRSGVVDPASPSRASSARTGSAVRGHRVSHAARHRPQRVRRALPRRRCW